MDRRHFILGTGAFLGLLGLGGPAEAKDNKKKKKPMGVEKPKRPPLAFVPGSWTFVVLPDTQKYSRIYPGLFQLQTEWIVKNKDKRNIAYVFQLGDITDCSTKLEWERASRCLGMLDSVVPYALVPGNHDYRGNGATVDRFTRINDYFPPSRFQQWRSFGGTMEAGRIENNYHLFEAGGSKWVAVGLEWGPRDATLQWADEILKKYADRKAIVFTHAYLYYDSTRYDWVKKGEKQRNNPHYFKTTFGGVNDGEEIWQKLIKKNPNVCMVLNGHVAGDGLGFQVSRGMHGNKVHEMLTDYQRREHGGAAWLRLLEFLPDGKTVQAKCYSPLYDEYCTGEEDQFTFTID